MTVAVRHFNSKSLLDVLFRQESDLQYISLNNNNMQHMWTDISIKTSLSLCNPCLYLSAGGAGASHRHRSKALQHSREDRTTWPKYHYMSEQENQCSHTQTPICEQRKIISKCYFPVFNCHLFHAFSLASALFFIYLYVRTKPSCLLLEVISQKEKVAQCYLNCLLTTIVCQLLKT